MAVPADSRYNLTMKTLRRLSLNHLLRLAILIVLFRTGMRVFAQGDNPAEPPPIIRLVAQQHPAMDELLPTITEALEQALADHGIAASLEVGTSPTSTGSPVTALTSGNESLFIEVSYSCPPRDPDCLRILLLPRRTPQSTLFSSHFDTGYGLSAVGTLAWLLIDLNDHFDAEILSFTDLVRGMMFFVNSDCANALPIFDQINAQSDALTITRYHSYEIDMLRVVCLRDQREYQAALDTLQLYTTEHETDHSDMLPLWVRAIINAYMADSLAQLFRFDEALAIDDATITHVRETITDFDNLLWGRLLADLYLLRGQHRLYLYEWDAVLADYNAALALEPAPPRAYYYRGLLYYTQNARQRAADDLARFLDLETDPNSPLIPLAEQYLDELAALPATPEEP